MSADKETVRYLLYLQTHMWKRTHLRITFTVYCVYICVRVYTHYLRSVLHDNRTMAETCVWHTRKNCSENLSILTERSWESHARCAKIWSSTEGGKFTPIARENNPIWSKSDCHGVYDNWTEVEPWGICLPSFLLSRFHKQINNEGTTKRQHTNNEGNPWPISNPNLGALCDKKEVKFSKENDRLPTSALAYTSYYMRRPSSIILYYY